MKVALVQKFGEQLKINEIPIPQLKQGQILIKIQATTVNPSDRIQISGVMGAPSLPFTGGKQGCGKVIQTKGQNVKSLQGKRVCFASGTGGSWAQNIILNPLKSMIFQIDQQVPIQNAASGIINPLTAIGFLDTFRSFGGKGGIIHTAAASSLGRQLNKLSKIQGIPLLNLVRRKQQAQILKSQGAQHVLITQGDWVQELKKYMNQHNFNTVFDALGGGQITDTLISSLNPKGRYILYGVLQNQPFTITNKRIFFSGINISGFFLSNWWYPLQQQKKQKIKKDYSQLLKKTLTTKTYKQLKLEDINQAIKLSVSHARQGKILIKIQ